MRCPFCSCVDSQVKDSRTSDDGSYIRRRRLCPECGSRFTTFERVQLREVFVKKSNGLEVPFDREKLMSSLKLATRKRNIDIERIDKIVSSIQRQIETSGESCVDAKFIGELVLDALSILDNVSYIRFASVYNQFDDLSDFKVFIDKIQKESSDNKNLESKPPAVKKIKDGLF